ncbi:MAG: hypothetical protein H2B01_09160 [Nitrosopumilaceae archaeon]|uniref:Uncharacterized protein n=1 Tax=Candidatus Nitrosomaritimum aestuariumsis TaxID=3342354 RepID=A0AC60WAZ5_9ARCH|nr:hypothetical protein [Nitrosopumilaceae archaeon]
MKKNMIVLFVALMAAAMLATPLVGMVMAKEKVEAELLVTGQDIDLGNIWTTNGGIQQQKGNTPTYYCNLILGEDTYPLVVACTSSATLNTETGYFVAFYDSVWYVGEEGADSGFKGMMIGRIYDFDTTGVFPPFSRIVIHCTLQGFGDFEGQTLKLSVDGNFFAYFTWTGYCIR